MDLSKIKALLSTQSNDSVQESSPAERMACDEPTTLIQKTKVNKPFPREKSQPQYDPSEDVIASGMVSEEVARTLLEG